MARKKIPDDRLIDLEDRLSLLPARSAERKRFIQEFAHLYGVSVNTVYRCLRERSRPKPLWRSDAGLPRNVTKDQMEKYCQVIAALKVRTCNKKGHKLSTAEAIRLLEFGVESPDGPIKVPKGLISKSTANHYLHLWGYTLSALAIEPVAVRFQADHSNECWHFDLSPSDLKKLEQWPDWVEQKPGRPLLMLYSIVDDRSGVAYDEYHVVYGEDVEAALRFLFNAMSPKNIDGFPFQGIPDMIYMDSGPIAKSHVFRRVMKYLGVEVRCHMPKNKDGRRTTARAKGKVERPFRTVKEMHETLYHFNKPANIIEANKWLLNHILLYNEKDHRSEPHSRIEDWRQNIPSTGIRKMCSWERFCTFARDPERRKVGPDAHVTISGTAYEVAHELADREVILWWGLFDQELYVECGDKKFGPYRPVGGPIPLHRFRSFKKTAAEKRADSIEALAQLISVSSRYMDADARPPEGLLRKLPEDVVFNEFQDPDPFQTKYFPSVYSAKAAISAHLAMPLGKLGAEDISAIDCILAQTMEKKAVMEKIKDHFKQNCPARAAKGDRSNDS
jgi:hypothetical protein